MIDMTEDKGNTQEEKETKEIEKGTKNFRIKINSLKNENKTWKIKLQIINASKISETYEPATNRLTARYQR